MVTTKTNEDFYIVPASHAVKAMRDSGFKNAAYAIAELVDNSIQAEADNIEILCQEEYEVVNNKNRLRLKELAIIDNGVGMNELMLRRALQFGNGNRLDDRSGIGRFGMGLPNSSISQARRLEVWTWQNGFKNAFYSYLDIGEIESGRLSTVPTPVKQAPPKIWIERSNTSKKSKSGTLVVWSNLDKCDWKTARSIFNNSEFLIGRVYRHFIGDDKVKIRMANFTSQQSDPSEFDKLAVPNDPLYLVPNKSLPAPWDTEPMFEAYGEPQIISVIKDEKNYEVKITFSVAKKQARDGFNTGDQPHGKHAKNNIGVSIVRSDRELELQTGWCNSYDSRERWWGVEVSFPAALDEIFGVTNNKQHATSLSEISAMGLEQIAEREGFADETELTDNWSDENNPRLLLLRIKQSIENNLSVIRSIIKSQGGSRSKDPKRHSDPNSAESIGTEATKVRQEDGFIGSSDEGETLPTDVRLEQIQKELQQLGVDEDDAQDRAQIVIQSGKKYEFYKVGVPTPEFFTVRQKSGVILIGLNTDHPAFDHLVTLLEPSDENNDVDSLRLRLSKSYEGLKLLLEAWARYEDELTDGNQKERAQDARLGWGRVARQFLKNE